MAKRLRVPVTVENDILVRLRDLHRRTQPLLRRPVCERRHQRDHGAAQAAGHPNMKEGPRHGIQQVEAQ